MRIGIGIDTGGTYTDAVLFDFESGKCISSGKALTTKHDLTVGISNALDKLDEEYLKEAIVLGLSTTMATNAAVEKKGGRAKLILWGIDKNTVERFGYKYGLNNIEDIYFQDSFPKYNGGYEKETDWELFKSNIIPLFGECDAVASVELFAMNTNALVEKESKAKINEVLDIPVVCGNDLFTDIDALQRGSSVLLNARLIPIVNKFTEAVKKVLKDKNLEVPIGIVRSDGSLMSEEFAMRCPVETVLSGPASSVMGGMMLTDRKYSLLVDMGGTTTDIAIIEDGVPKQVTNGVRIGEYKTFVKGMYIYTFGLGGDSAVRFEGDDIYLDEKRVVPLCVLAADYPEIKEILKKISEEPKGHTRFIHEFFILLKDIADDHRYTETEKKFCEGLKSGPKCLREAAAYIGTDEYHINVDRLEEENVVIRAGLTPTDMMHILGDFNTYDKEASILGAKFFVNSAANVKSPEDLAEKVYTEVKRKLYLNIVKCILEHTDDYFEKNGVDEGMERYINEAFYESAGKKDKNSFITKKFDFNCTLVGIGAPIKLFLESVAKMLSCEVVIPENYQVANALGAINGSITSTKTFEIRPVTTGGYVVYGNEENKFFYYLSEAKEYAVDTLKVITKDETIKKGAVGDISFRCRDDDIRTKSKDNISVYIGSEISVTASGKAFI